uniref:Uncharacterized protein n=1 Tax=Siphoviridae sp. ctwQT14 TaxID=2827971 RepID=A0A8S5TLC2_9CAUD|nr:MAG TPA: hypothetical protein [Siphoviridae sp. ctwQT14]
MICVYKVNNCLINTITLFNIIVKLVLCKDNLTILEKYSKNNF